MKNIDKINPFMNLKAIMAFSNFYGNLADKINNVIHVAGTNGKGSTIAFLRAILEAQGYSVNVFTSPHLVYKNERIRIRGKLISNKYFTALNKFILKNEVGKNLSVFELFMAQALVAFTENPADFTILEVGLGGRLDATNIIKNPLACVITPIDLDHEHILGNTKAEIALEKAAIIKKNSLVVSAYQSPDVIQVLQQESSKKEAKLLLGDKDWFIKDKYNNHTIQGNYNKTLFFNEHSYILKNIALQGDHQLYNSSLAIVTLKEILRNNITKKSIYEGLKKVNWFGRLQSLPYNSLYGLFFNKKDKLILDGAHNKHGAKALSNFIENVSKNEQVFLIMAMLKTKNIISYLEYFKKINNLTIYGVSLNKDFNAYSSKEIQSCAVSLGLKAKIARSVKHALLDIYTHKSKKTILIGGSLYLIGKVLKDNKIIPT